MSPFNHKPLICMVVAAESRCHPLHLGRLLLIVPHAHNFITTPAGEKSLSCDQGAGENGTDFVPLVEFERRLLSHFHPIR